MKKTSFVGLLLLIIAVFCGFVFAQSVRQAENNLLTQIKDFRYYHQGRFSGDGKMMALTNVKGYIDVVNIPSGGKICRIDSPGAVFYATSFSSDNKWIAAYYKLTSGNEPYKLTLWESTTCREIKTLYSSAYRGAPEFLSFSADGNFLAAFTDESKVWEVSTGKEIYRKSFSGKSLKQETLLSPNGEWIATYIGSLKEDGNRSGKLYIFNLKTSESLELETRTVDYFLFSDDSRTLVTRTNVDSVLDAGGIRVEIWDVNGWKRKQVIELNEIWSNDVFAIDVSPDNRMLAIGGSERFGLISLQTGKLISEQYHHKKTSWEKLRDTSEIYYWINHIEFSPDSKMLSTGGEDSRVKLWRIDQK